MHGGRITGMAVLAAVTLAWRKRLRMALAAERNLKRIARRARATLGR